MEFLNFASHPFTDCAQSQSDSTNSGKVNHQRTKTFDGLATTSAENSLSEAPDKWIDECGMHSYRWVTWVKKSYVENHNRGWANQSDVQINAYLRLVNATANQPRRLNSRYHLTILSVITVLKNSWNLVGRVTVHVYKRVLANLHLNVCIWVSVAIWVNLYMVVHI